jgi:hypothetical protein
MTDGLVHKLTEELIGELAEKVYVSDIVDLPLVLNRNLAILGKLSIYY